MSKQHQASRRRTYGRRLHELHERTERPVGLFGWIEMDSTDESAARVGLDRAEYADAGPRIASRGID